MTNTKSNVIDRFIEPGGFDRAMQKALVELKENNQLNSTKSSQLEIAEMIDYSPACEVYEG